MTKAIGLLSGGLDSTLAAKVIMDQGIEVEAVNIKTVFCNYTARGKSCLASKTAADQLGIKLKVFEVSKEYFEVVKNPKHGYGSNMNPCLDCRIFIFKKAAEYMKKVGASFLFTGEVLGQRPMSQRKDAMRVIERDSGLEGLILRPLSAGLLKPTTPENEGIVDRDKLLSLEGRSRKPQFSLAKKFGINDFPYPAGGCLLTDPGFANRMRDLIKHTPDFEINDAELIKTGRLFRLTADAKLLVGRNEGENNRLLSIAKEQDIVFYPTEVTGPVGVGRGVFSPETLDLAFKIIARYCDKKEKEVKISFKVVNKEEKTITSSPIEDEKLEGFRI